VFALNQLITYLAVPTVAYLSWRMVPRMPLGLDGWRWAVLIGSAGAVLIWAIRMRLPESPRWLAAHGEKARAEAVLAALEQRVERETGKALLEPEAESNEAVVGGRLQEIFSRTYRSRTLMLSTFHVFQTIGVYGFSNWVPTFLMKQGIEVTTSLSYTLGTTLVMPVGPFIAMLYGDRFERKWQIAISSLVVAAAGLLFAEARNPIFIVVTGDRWPRDAGRDDALI